jgi:hypothetical protein
MHLMTRLLRGPKCETGTRSIEDLSQQPKATILGPDSDTRLGSSPKEALTIDAAEKSSISENSPRALSSLKSIGARVRLLWLCGGVVEGEERKNALQAPMT